ncbi:MAG: histidine phosphotransferase family protein [Rhodobacteraceae bacterium]|nr:histidine phosphotransferase family protein [Paracoccaceae bacterium]
MSHTTLDLPTLIGSRICHDLISPIGAIANGLELLGMTGAVTGPEMGLISDSAESAGARIRFFRIAYGAPGQQIMGRAEVAGLLRDAGRGGRVQVRWLSEDAQPRRMIRLAFLALQCCETAMPYGGKVTIRVDGLAWSITGEADKMHFETAVWAALDAGDTDAITAATVQFALLPTVARDEGRCVTCVRETRRLRISF